MTPFPRRSAHGSASQHRHAPRPPHLAAVTGVFLSLVASAADQPQWGHAWDRNLVSEERGLPVSFDPAAGLNVKWTAKLGTETYSTPIIAGGRVYIGTNNEHPRDPRRSGDRGVLLCLNERDGQLLWQFAVPKREIDPYYDWPKTGMSSPVTVEGNRVYQVNNRGEVVCLDARGMANGNDGPYRDEATYLTLKTEATAGNLVPPGPLDGDMLWTFDMTREVGIWSHDGAHSSILIDGDFLYINTSTGVDNTHRVIRTPDAPSLVVLNKHTGRLVARDQEHIGPNIFHCTWSSPSLAMISGNRTLVFAAGNGWIYGFDPVKTAPGSGQPLALVKRWQVEFDTQHPPGDIHSFLSNRREGPSNIYGMPVIHDGRILVAGGGDWFWGKNEAWLKCFQPDAKGGFGADSLRWSLPIGRHTMATPSVHDGRVYVTDSQYNLHCVDAATGTSIWTHDLGAEIWASALVADGKVYVGTRRGGFWTFRDSREKEVLGHVDLPSPICSTTTAANRTLYVATMTRLYAVTGR